MTLNIKEITVNTDFIIGYVEFKNEVYFMLGTESSGYEDGLHVISNTKDISQINQFIEHINALTREDEIEKVGNELFTFIKTNSRYEDEISIFHQTGGTLQPRQPK